MNPPRASAACSIAVGLIFSMPLASGKFCGLLERRGVISQINPDSTLIAGAGVLVFARRELIFAVN